MCIRCESRRFFVAPRFLRFSQVKLELILADGALQTFVDAPDHKGELKLPEGEHVVVDAVAHLWVGHVDHTQVDQSCVQYFRYQELHDRREKQYYLLLWPLCLLESSDLLVNLELLRVHVKSI